MSVRALAFYLPQFHPVPDNDNWWGPGFTDWRRVAVTDPRFRHHYQPHVPRELGYYDLRLPEVRKAQASLARSHGIEGFCYYHYWFNGRRLLSRPLDEVIQSGEPDFPFCLCWANENWTRAWDGHDDDVLVKQIYSEEDDRQHGRWLAGVFSDPRYINFEGRPLFLVYRASRLPDPRRTTDIWREETTRAGLPDPYLCRVESFPDERGAPSELGFDAAVEFQPDWASLGPPSLLHLATSALRARGMPPVKVFNYRRVVHRMLAAPSPEYRRFPSVTPSWDNSPRRRKLATVLHPTDPQAYEHWLRVVSDRLARSDPGAFVFINAWNEWAEGAHLEPDMRHGLAWLEATSRALRAHGPGQGTSGCST